MSFSPAAFPLQEHLGMTMESARRGVAVARLGVAEHLLNPNGVVHGAVLFAMADTAMGAATTSVLEDGHICASIEVHVRFLRPVSQGELVCDAEVLRPGRRVVQLGAQIRAEPGPLIATATGSFAVVPT